MLRLTYVTAQMSARRVIDDPNDPFYLEGLGLPVGWVNIPVPHLNRATRSLSGANRSIVRRARRRFKNRQYTRDLRRRREERAAEVTIAVVAVAEAVEAANVEAAFAAGVAVGQASQDIAK